MDEPKDKNIENEEFSAPRERKQPEIEPKNDSKIPMPEELIPPNLQSYHSKIENQWEDAKENFQKRIDQIMDNFIKEKLVSENWDSTPSEEKSGSQPENKKKSPSEEKRWMPPVPKRNWIKDTWTSMLGRGKSGSFVPSYDKPTIVDMEWGHPKNQKSFLGLIFLFALLLGGAIVYLSRRIPQLSPLPFDRSSAIAVHQDSIWIVDWFRRDLYKHKKRRGLNIQTIEILPNEYPTGLVITSEALWSLDGFQGEILKHTLTKDHSVLARFPTPGSKPTGLFFDGADLWTSDEYAKILFRHHGSDPREIREKYQYETGAWAGFTIDEHRVLALVRDSRLLVEFRIQNPLKIMATYDLDPYLNGGNPTSIFKKGDTLWMTTENPSQLLKLRKGQLNPIQE